MIDTEQNVPTRLRILIVTEFEDQDTMLIANRLITKLHLSNLFHLFSHHPLENVTLLSHTKDANEVKLNYIISLGENFTTLRALRYNKDNKNIPIISISNGHEHIMSSYSYNDIDEIVAKFIKAVRKNDVKLQKIMRMQVFSSNSKETNQFLTNFSCDLEIHRDMKSSVLKISIFLRTEGKDFYELTSLWGDGLIISTPFGSMGRSMAHSGPILHENIECIQLIPICPLSLKFRPIILPKDSQLLIKVPEDSRSIGKIFSDGEFIQDLHLNSSIKVRRDTGTSTKLVKGLGKGEEISWIFKLQEVLSWGEHYSSFKNLNSKPKKSLSKECIKGERKSSFEEELEESQKSEDSQKLKDSAKNDEKHIQKSLTGTEN